jgi:hypothetical protein
MPLPKKQFTELEKERLEKLRADKKKTLENKEQILK